MLSPMFFRVPARLALAVPLTVVAVLAGACSSSPAKSSTQTTRTLPKSISHDTSPPPTTAPPRATTPIEVAGVVAEISGSSAVIQFTSPAVTSNLATTGPAFSNSGKTFDVTITGVTYNGGTVTASGPPTNRISRIVVTHASSGVAVTISLIQAASNDHVTIGQNQVTIAFS
jgi:hypothetical protein